MDLYSSFCQKNDVSCVIEPRIASFGFFMGHAFYGIYSKYFNNRNYKWLNSNLDFLKIIIYTSNIILSLQGFYRLNSKSLDTLNISKLTESIIPLLVFTNSAWIGIECQKIFEGTSSSESTLDTATPTPKNLLDTPNIQVNPKSNNASSITYDSIMKVFNNTIVGQVDAKEQIAQAISLFMARQNLISEEDSLKNKRCNLLLTGPSGTGKTSLAKAIAEATKRPLLTIDANSISPEGIRGASLHDYIISFLDNEGKQDAENGIIFIDEIDKLFSSDHPFSSSIKNQLLKMLEGSILKMQPYLRPVMTFDTSKTIFILGGCFESIQQEEKSGGTIDSDRLLTFGLSRELIGRITDIVPLNPISQEEYEQVLQLKNGSASLAVWKKEFASAGAELIVDQEVINKIIEHSIDRKMGVRGLDYFLRLLLNDKLTKCSRNFSKEATILEPLVPVHVTMEDWDATSFAQDLVKRKQFPSLNEIRKILETEVIGQEDAKKVLSEAIFYHTLRLDSGIPIPKGNVLIVGPSGSGKTYMMEILAKATQLPVAAIDASKLVRTGIIGSQIEDVFVKLLEQTKGDVKQASRGIVFFDEFDKQIEDSSQSDNKVSGDAIQNQLLRLMQGDIIKVKYQNMEISLNTKDILFVTAGAFSKFPQLYFSEEINENILLSTGIRPEFLGRISYFTRLNAITEQDLQNYLMKDCETSPLNLWKALFKKRNIEMRLTEEDMNNLVKEAASKTTGFRALVNGLQRFLIPQLDVLPESVE